MRTTAIIAIFGIAGTVAAQFPPGFGPPLRPGHELMTTRGFWGLSFPYRCYSWWMPAPVIVVQPPTIQVLPSESKQLDSLLRKLPQVPPRDELALLRRPEPAPPPPKRDFNADSPLVAAKPAADKKVEARRQATLGKQAFAAGEPGQALERFERALALAPNVAAHYFLAAQSQFALGRYREAASMALAGLKRQPNGPGDSVNPRELYGLQPGDLALDLDRLRQAVARQPDEPSLSFLLGYELWINGRPEDAKPHLERSASQAADPAPIRRLMGIP